VARVRSGRIGLSRAESGGKKSREWREVYRGVRTERAQPMFAGRIVDTCNATLKPVSEINTRTALHCY